MIQILLLIDIKGNESTRWHSTIPWQTQGGQNEGQMARLQRTQRGDRATEAFLEKRVPETRRKTEERKRNLKLAVFSAV